MQLISHDQGNNYESSSQNYGNGIQIEPQMVNKNVRELAEREAIRNQQLEENLFNPPVVNRYQSSTFQMNMKNLLHNPEEKSTFYEPDFLRFTKDYAKQDKMYRDFQARNKDVKTEAKRIEKVQREAHNWERNQEKQQKDLYCYRSQGKHNQNGLAINPITQSYQQSAGGWNLKERDDKHKIKELVRAENIERRSNCGYNVVNGNPNNTIQNIVPTYLKNEYSQKVREKEDFYNIKHYMVQQQILNTQQGNSNNGKSQQKNYPSGSYSATHGIY